MGLSNSAATIAGIVAPQVAKTIASSSVRALNKLLLLIFYDIVGSHTTQRNS